MTGLGVQPESRGTGRAQFWEQPALGTRGEEQGTRRGGLRPNTSRLRMPSQGLCAHPTGHRELSKFSEQGSDPQSCVSSTDIGMAQKKETLEMSKKIKVKIKTNRNRLLSVILVQRIFRSQADELK